MIAILKKKERARQKWKRSDNENHYRSYSQLRTRSKIEIEKCHQLYLNQLQNNIKNNIKLFWSYTKNRKQSNSYPSVMKYGNECSDDPQRICELFSTFFMSTYKSQNPVQNTNNTLNCISHSNHESQPTISVGAVEEVLRKVDINKNGGPDKIPNIFLRNCATPLARPLSFLFNKSLMSGVFPSLFKSAFVTPIFKNGDHSDVVNYRPVALLNSIALVFEKIVHRQLLTLLENKLSHRQHGFTKNKSTGTNLSEYINYVALALDNGFEVHAIYTDFSKAFDTVNHRILLRKLKALGIRGKFLEWIKSYLSDRALCVTFNGSKSSSFSPPSGVPQFSFRTVAVQCFYQ